METILVVGLEFMHEAQLMTIQSIDGDDVMAVTEDLQPRTIRRIIVEELVNSYYA